ncbi:Spo0E family sporulation regulatory protein-aspartic acid phosphatase [Paenibacillus glucanolyticus]|uniref:Spo0E family sporulation regulatory protein-aspartic acid phosphatase n=1 Tax=Paenibacillus glucanolyticus TaxID=59843 RepID=UPI003D02623C
MNNEAAKTSLPALAAEIESMRAEMELLFDAIGELAPEVIDISQKLDALICRYMTLKRMG